MKKRIVIIGGCAAGPKVAAKSRRMDSQSEISLYTIGNVISYSACGIPYFVGGVIKNINQLIVRTPDDFKKNNINVFLNHKCTEILPSKQQVIINGKEIDYDELVLATGALPYSPNIKNIGLKNVFYLRTLNDGFCIREISSISKTVLIIGFGYIALEMIEAFLKNNLNVIVVENDSHIMSFLDSEISDIVEKHILDNYGGSVQIIKDDSVVAFLGEKYFKGAITRNGVKINADFCLISAGVVPNAGIAHECGIEIGQTGGIRTDSRMRTNIKHIWAVGDCREKNCIITGLPTYSALGSIANKEGRVCAINLNGGDEEFPGVLGSSITKFFDYTISTTGVSEKRAIEIKDKIGIEPVSKIVTKFDKASYMPNVKEITIKLIADKKTGTILGAQGIGLGDVDKRISVVVSALQKRMTINELIHLDLTYMPETSGTIDPLLTLCYELKKEIGD